MFIPYIEAQLEIIMRAADRGRLEALRSAPAMIDSFQHVHDEAERTLLYIQEKRNGNN